MAVSDYASILTEVNSHTDRTYTQAQIDTFIGLFEADAQLELGPNYQRETSSTLTVTSGSATLPTGFVRAIEATHATYGRIDEASIGAVRDRRVWDTSGIPEIYAVTGTTVETAPSFTGSLTFDYESTFAPLTSSNTSNWLITAAPQSYFWGVMGQARAFQKDFTTAAALGGMALGVVRKVVERSVVAQFGRASVKISGSTP